MVVIILVKLLILATIIYAVFDVIIPLFLGKPVFSLIKSLKKKKQDDKDSKYNDLFKNKNFNV